MQLWLYKRSGSTTKIHETSSASRPSLQSHSSATLTLRTSLRSTPLRPFLFGSLNVVGSRTTTRESQPHQSLVIYVDVTLGNERDNTWYYIIFYNTKYLHTSTYLVIGYEVQVASWTIVNDQIHTIYNIVSKLCYVLILRDVTHNIHAISSVIFSQTDEKIHKTSEIPCKPHDQSNIYFKSNI